MTESRRTWRGSAPAKVNLRLTVLGREPDGYHRLETVFQRLQLADEIELHLGGVRKDETDNPHLEVTGVADGALGPDSENLAVRAARSFTAALADTAQPPGTAFLASGLSIRLRKRIPSGAGLGGGSSDAATVLRGLNELAGMPMDGDELMRVGGRLGSDVPFFLSGASRAFGSGRGDRIAPLPSLPARHVLLAVPTAPISTGWAYEVLAAARAALETPASAVRPEAPELETTPGEGISEGGWNEVAAAAHNDFEVSLFPLRPDLARLKESLQGAGARPALLSGSGSVVFGIFEDAASMERAADRVQTTDTTVRLIRTTTDGS